MKKTGTAFPGLDDADEATRADFGASLDFEPLDMEATILGADESASSATFVAPELGAMGSGGFAPPPAPSRAFSRAGTTPPPAARAGTIPPRPATAPPAAPPRTSETFPSVSGAHESSLHTPMSGDSSAGGLGPGMPALTPGTRINQYELIRELGRGGMGAVFLARDTRLGRRAAIKFLQSGQPELTERFQREAVATAQFNHENIVVLYDAGEYQGHPFMVLEYLQGSPLTKLLKKGARLPPTRAVELIVPVVRALVVAHERNIVHRDLKPDNIFITDTGTVKVLDFGIAKLMESHEPRSAPMRASVPDLRALASSASSQVSTGATDTGELTRVGAIMGTLPYMSPEQWGIVEADHRTDLWAIGILLFRMVAGKHPLHPLRGQQLVVTAILDEPMPRARDVCPDIPPDLAAIIDACLVKHKERRVGSAKDLLAMLEPLLPGRATRQWNTDESPYAGLAAFQEADADRFFGRSREIAAVAARLRDQPLLGMVGPSGVGKSSFVRAGVVPALKQSGESWETVVVRPGRHPMAALANAVAPLLEDAGTGRTGQHTAVSALHDISEHEAVIRRLKNEPGFLGTVLRSHARRKKTRVMVFIDQFEELYTLSQDADERLRFTTCLAGAADDATAPLRVVISIRSDFLDRVAEDPHFMSELTQGLVFLTPPNRAGLREALTMPAEMAGYRYENPAMIEQMLDHLDNTPGALPLLQFAATKLWEARDTGRRLLTEQSYHSIGGIVGALASHAESVLNELAAPAQSLVQAIFLRLVTPERTRAIVSVAELAELSPDQAEVQRLVNHLVQARLLVTQTGEGGSAAGASVEIVHESLLHSWPRLRRWLEENQDDAAFLEQLRTAARQWQAKGRATGLLWRGEAMEEAKRWVRRYRGELPDLQRAYLHAVFALERRTVARKRLLLAGVIGTLSLMVAAAAVALVLIRDAQMQATADAARAVAAEKKARESEQKAVGSAEEAQANLASLQAEMAAREEAERKTKEAEEEVRLAYQNLKNANENLEDALDRAKRSQRRARRAKRRAEENESDALMARTEALSAKEEVESLLEREKERSKRLLQQLGSPMIDTLK